jgi:hypothetical protein
MVSRAGQLVNQAAELTDEATRAQLRKFLAGFVAYVEE